MPPWIGIAVAVLMGVINLVYSASRNQKSDDKEIRKAITDLQERTVKMETKIDVFWKGVSFSAAQVLHSPHTPELDVLIEKFQQDRIDDQEIREFKKMLRAIASDESDKLKQKAARDVLTLIRVRYEIGSELQEVA